jgi:5-methyltetrahydrofolate--homocysteine methyltransferase
VNDPGARNVTFDRAAGGLLRRPRGLLDGGADVLLIETIFDTLNAKAAIFAVRAGVRGTRAMRVPVMISGTITDASGRTLTGQTTEAFWNSMRTSKPISVGLNCALGAARSCAPTSQELSRVADCFVSAYPNAGLPNAFGGYDETPASMAAILASSRSPAWSTWSAAAAARRPAHIPRSPRRCGRCRPGGPRDPEARLRLSGLEPLTIGEDSLFVNVGERTNVTGLEALRASSSSAGTTTRRSRSRASRSTPAPSSSTSTWTRACSTPRRR